MISFKQIEHADFLYEIYIRKHHIDFAKTEQNKTEHPGNDIRTGTLVAYGVRQFFAKILQTN